MMQLITNCKGDDDDDDDDDSDDDAVVVSMEREVVRIQLLCQNQVEYLILLIFKIAFSIAYYVLCTYILLDYI